MKIEKNKIFYILGLFLLLLPFKVKANTYRLEGAQIFQYHANTAVKNITSGIGELAGANYYYSLASIPNGDYFSLIFPFFDDKSYTINGSIFIDTSQNVSFMSYPLSLNGIVCEVTPVYELSNSDMARRIFSYSCPDVTMKKENNQFNFQSNANIVNNIFGFSYNITYSSSISGAINNQTEEITKGQDEIKQQQQETNGKLDEMIDSDISESDKEMPDSSSYDDYSSSQDELLDKTKDVDLDILDVGLDVKSSSWVWDTLTSLIESHSAVFGMFIAILSIGVIKLVLGR